MLVQNEIKKVMRIEKKEVFFLLSLIAIFGIFVFLVQIAIPKPGDFERSIVTHEIVSIQKTDGVSGNFFLGSGQINSQQYFYFYEKVEGGGLLLRKILATDVVIEQHSDINPQFLEGKEGNGGSFAERKYLKLILPKNTVHVEFSSI